VTTVKAKPKYSKKTFPIETLFNTKHIITMATTPILCMAEGAFSLHFMKIHYMWSFFPKNIRKLQRLLDINICKDQLL
jgi:hypothetical protein